MISIVFACVLMTPQVITDGYCSVMDGKLVFQKQLYDSEYSIEYPESKCVVKVEDKALIVRHGKHRIIQQKVVRCQ